MDHKNVQNAAPESEPVSPVLQSNTDVEKQAGSEPERISSIPKTSAFRSLGWLDQYLAVWIFLAMGVGIILGNFVPNTGPALQRGEFIGVSIPIGKCLYVYVSPDISGNQLTFNAAVGLLVMMYPILCKVKFETLHHVFRKREIWTQVGFSIFVNWIIAPFVMVKNPYLIFLRISLLISPTVRTCVGLSP